MVIENETRRPEYIPQPVPRQTQPLKHIVQVEVHTLMEPPEPEVPIKLQIPDEPLDRGEEPLT